MVMNLKPAIRFNLRELAVGGLVFWGVNALIIALCFAGFLAFGPAEDGVVSYNGCGMACAIFAFVYGLVMPRQSMRLCVQMGISRRTTFLSLLLATVTGALLLALSCELLLLISQGIARAAHIGEQFLGLFALVYPSHTTGLALHLLPILYTAAAMLTLFALGLFFTFLFWRLNKIGCIIAALAIPVILTGVPSLLTVFHTLFAPVIDLLQRIFDAFLESPWFAIVLYLVVALVFVLISWLLIRRTNIRGSSLSNK